MPGYNILCGDGMSETSRFADSLSPAAWTGRLLLAAGTALCLAAAICFFAWNWHKLADVVKFSLATGGFLLCTGLSLAAERRNTPLPASLALLASCMCIGMFWAVFGQIFQSGATEQDLCLVWAASMLPLLLLRRTACLWNLWAILIVAAALPRFGLDIYDAYLSRPLPALVVNAALCCIALLPPRLLRRSGSLNSWLALPLTLLITQASLLSFHLVFSEFGSPPLPRLLTGPAVLAAILVPALHRRHALALCELSLAGLVLLNSLFTRWIFEAGTENLIPVIFLFTLANIAYTAFLARSLPRALRNPEEKTALTPAFQKETETAAHAPRQQNARAALPHLFPLILAGLGGGVSAIFFTVLSVLFFAITSQEAGLGLGAVYMATGALLWRIRGRGVFLLTFSPVMAAAGAAFFHYGLTEFPTPILIAYIWAAAIALYAALNCMPLRFGAALWPLLTTLFCIRHSLPPEYIILVACSFGIACFLPLVAVAWGRVSSAALRPAAFACLWAFIGQTPLFAGSVALIDKFPEQALFPPVLLRSLCAANLVLFAWRAMPPRGTPGFPHPASLAAGAASLLPAWSFAPAEALLALNLMLIGRFAQHREKKAWHSFPLFCTGLLLLAASLVSFYYHLALPFSAKVLSMGIPGLCLVFGGMVLERGSRSASANSKSDTESGDNPVLLPRSVFFRRAAPLAATSLILPILFSLAISDRRALLRDGREILLALAPRDPRAFMLGDYMTLEYDLERQFQVDKNGCLPLIPDEQGIARADPEHFVQGKSCNGVPAPALRTERNSPRSARLRLPRRYYFEEGMARFYEDAHYAVLRCNENNDCLLAGLADSAGQRIEPCSDAHGGE